MDGSSRGTSSRESSPSTTRGGGSTGGLGAASSRVSSTGSPILHVKAAKPQVQWQQHQKQKQQHGLKAATERNSTSTHIMNKQKERSATAGPAGSSSSCSQTASSQKDCSQNIPASQRSIVKTAKSNLTTANSSVKTNSIQASPKLHSKSSGNHSHGSHKLKHHHLSGQDKHKHHKHRLHGKGGASVSPASSGSAPSGKQHHKKRHHRPSQRNDHNHRHHMEGKGGDHSKKEHLNSHASQKYSASTNGSAPSSPAPSSPASTSSGRGYSHTGVHRAVRELAQLRADLVEIGVDPGIDDDLGAGSNPSTPSGRKGPGRGRGRQPMQYEEINSFADEELGITYKKGGKYSIQLHIHTLLQKDNFFPSELCHAKTGLKIFVVVIPKEGLAGGPRGLNNLSFGMTPTREYDL